MDTKLAVAEYRPFRKDHPKGTTCGDVAQMVQNTIPAVPPLPDIPVNDVVACNIDPLESRLMVICVHCPHVEIRSLLIRQSHSLRLSGWFHFLLLWTLHVFRCERSPRYAKLHCFPA